MITLAIRIESDGPLLILQDSQWGIAEACQFRDPFLKGLVLDAEFRLEQKPSAADPQST
jgi:hypothetical protein